MRLLILFILLSLGAEASNAQIIRANAFYRPTTTQFLLDAYPNAAAAYSLRKLKASYSGSAIRVRRSNDNTEQDIGFTSVGDLDTASMKTFVGANSGFVVTWYNQGDSTSIDFSQTTQASQPRIINAGVIERRAGDPTIRFDVSGTSDFMDAASTSKFNYLHKAGQAAVFMICQAGVANTNPGLFYMFINNNNQSAGVGYSLYYDDRAGVSANNSITSLVTRASGSFVSINQPNNFFAADTLALITNLLDNSNGTAANRNFLYRNGINEIKANSATGVASTANALNNMRIGRYSNATTNPLNGFISEIVLYPTDQSSNRTGIETNINNYYGLW